MKKILGFLLVIICYTIFTTKAMAQYGITTYNYSILIDKTVAVPNASNTNSNNYIDNLSPNDPRFHPSNDVYFRIRVKNTSDRNLTSVWVRDYVPIYISPLEGPGTWDLTNRIISWNAGDFNINEEKIYYLKMRVYNQNLLPADKGLFCVVNRADARNDNVYDDDSSQICIEKEVLGVKEVPSAGPEMGLVLLAGEFGLLGLGRFLMKKTDGLDK